LCKSFQLRAAAGLRSCEEKLEGTLLKAIEGALLLLLLLLLQ
jgi:hypothetical protein